jgi:hypothetical protein
MPHGFILPVEIQGIALIDALQYFIEWDFPGLNEQVNMVGHENVGIKRKLISRFVSLQYLKIDAIIIVGPEDFALLVSTDNYMIKCAFKLDSGLSGHKEDYQKTVICKY